MELEETGFLTSEYAMKLQSSKRYGTEIKLEIQINGIGQRVQRLNPYNYGHLVYDKRGKKYSGENTVSSMSGAVKTRQLYGKE